MHMSFFLFMASVCEVTCVADGKAVKRTQSVCVYTWREQMGISNRKKDKTPSYSVKRARDGYDTWWVTSESQEALRKARPRRPV